MGAEGLFGKVAEAFLTGAAERSPLLGAISNQIGGAKKKPAGGATKTTTTTKAGAKSKPGFLEDFLTQLAASGSSKFSGIPQVPPIVGAPAPPRGDPNTQRLLEAIIAELSGMGQRR